MRKGWEFDGGLFLRVEWLGKSVVSVSIELLRTKIILNYRKTKVESETPIIKG